MSVREAPDAATYTKPILAFQRLPEKSCGLVGRLGSAYPSKFLRSHPCGSAEYLTVSQDGEVVTNTNALRHHCKLRRVVPMLGIGRTKVYEMMSAGELPVVRIGTAVRVPRQGLLDWIQENTQRAA